jgi:hypothetical protein
MPDAGTNQFAQYISYEPTLTGIYSSMEQSICRYSTYENTLFCWGADIQLIIMKVLEIIKKAVL